MRVSRISAVLRSLGSTAVLGSRPYALSRGSLESRADLGSTAALGSLGSLDSTAVLDCVVDLGSMVAAFLLSTKVVGRISAVVLTGVLDPASRSLWAEALASRSRRSPRSSRLYPLSFSDVCLLDIFDVGLPQLSGWLSSGDKLCVRPSCFCRCCPFNGIGVTAWGFRVPQCDGLRWQRISASVMRGPVCTVL